MFETNTGWEPNTFVMRGIAQCGNLLSIGMMQPVFEWCRQSGIVYYFNTGYVPDAGNVFTMSFDNEKDAILFKLRWSELIY